jgi:hypothetical protein
LFSPSPFEERKRLIVRDELGTHRLTARKFLAAANFLEVLSIFGELSAEVRCSPSSLLLNTN